MRKQTTSTTPRRLIAPTIAPTAVSTVAPTPAPTAHEAFTRSATLNRLSDIELLSMIDTLRKREHTTTLDILHHLNEIERRRLHLKLGYGSLFDYCTRHLYYSASAAGRRIQVARSIRRHPEICALLQHRKVTLMTISLISSIITPANKRELFEAVSNKTQREVEAIASQYRPPIALRDRVMPVKVHVANHSKIGNGTASEMAASRNRPGASLPTRSNNGLAFAVKSASGKPAPECPDSQCGSVFGSSLDESSSEQKLYIQFLAGTDFMQKYEKARSLLSQRLSDTSFESVFEVLIEDFLKRNSPDRTLARRTAKAKPETRTKPRAAAIRSKKQANGSSKINSNNRAEKQDQTAPHEKGQSRPGPPSLSRHIPAALREKIFARDRGRCTYVSETGRRCNSSHALQIDHIVPFARGGATSIDNLRLLCAQHNRLEAENTYGTEIARRYQARE